MEPWRLSATDRRPGTGSPRRCAPAVRITAAPTAAVLAHRAGDRRLGRLRALLLHMALQVPVVALGRADITVPELVLHILQGVAARQPRRSALCRSACNGISRRSASCNAALCQSRETVVRSNGLPSPSPSQRPWSVLRTRTGIV